MDKPDENVTSEFEKNIAGAVEAVLVLTSEEWTQLTQLPEKPRRALIALARLSSEQMCIARSLLSALSRSVNARKIGTWEDKWRETVERFEVIEERIIA